MSQPQREFHTGFNYYVPAAKAMGDLGQNLSQRVQLGAPVVADPDGIIDGQSIAAAVTVTAFAATYTTAKMGKFGRNLTVVADGAATSAVDVYGRDYLGQPIRETLTLNGTTAVQGVKAFKYIDKVVCAATASRAIDLGWGAKLGLPYNCIAVEREFEDGVVAAAGTLVAGVRTDPQTATTADPRGLYTTTGTLDGTAMFEIDCQFDNYVNSSGNGGLHGVKHYNA